MCRSERDTDRNHLEHGGEKMKRWITLAALASMAMACGQGNGGEGGEDDGREDEETIEGVAPEVFYGRYDYTEEIGQYLYGHGALTDQPDGDDAFVIWFFLEQDKTARVYYLEGTYVIDDGPNFQITGGPDTPIRVDTNWSVEEKTLVVEDLLRCMPVEQGEDGEFSCVIQRGLISAQTEGLDVTFYFDTGLSIDDGRFDDYEPEG